MWRLSNVLFLKYFFQTDDISHFKLHSNIQNSTLFPPVINLIAVYDLCVNNFLGDIKHKSRDFYRYIFSLKKDTQDISPLKIIKVIVSPNKDLSMQKNSKINSWMRSIKWIQRQILLFRRLVPFMDNTVISAERVTKPPERAGLFWSFLVWQGSSLSPGGTWDWISSQVCPFFSAITWDEWNLWKWSLGKLCWQYMYLLSPLSD